MKRIKVKNVDAILTADWHIRADTPVCRIDDYLTAMMKKVYFIFDLAKTHACPILIAGDLGHKPQWPNWLLRKFIHATNVFKRPDILVVPGQHDLPNHNVEQWGMSGLGVLVSAKRVEMLLCGLHTIYGTLGIDAFPYGHNIYCTHTTVGTDRFIAMAHQMVIDKPLWPGQEAPKGHQLLKEFPEYDLILTGDNHKPFIAKSEGRLLVNPGSMMRMTTDQADHEPRVYLWSARDNTVEPAYLPITKRGIISTKHLETNDKRVRREAFFERVREDVEIGLSFERNVEEHLKQQSIQKRVKEKVWEAIG